MVLRGVEGGWKRVQTKIKQGNRQTSMLLINSQSRVIRPNDPILSLISLFIENS